jgi:hypothetical protein
MSLARMPRALRVLNVLTGMASLASGLAVLGSDLFNPAYPYRDSIAFVLAYCSFYVVVIVAFWRGTPMAPLLAIVKTLGAYGFLFVVLGFPQLGQPWMAFTPGRYVYQVFDWGPEAQIGVFAFVFLGRGAWNTVNAFACTRDWWFAMRARRPLVGRLLTAVPIGITVLCAWLFLSLVRMEATTLSPEAHEVARLVAGGLTCEDVRAKAGTTTTDVRQRGERRYEVTIAWDCTDLRVVVRAEDGRAGTARTPRLECCGAAPGSGPDR